MSNNFLVIAPHSYCVNEKIRHCDKVAAEVVDVLRESFKKDNCIFHISDQKREYGDYNRPETDGTAWRTKMVEYARSINPDFVLEIHSFPARADIYKIWHNSELVIFESESNKIFLNKLIKILRRNDSYLKVMAGHPWHPVSITDDISKLNKKHALFEFNETLDHARLSKIADNLANAVRELVNENIKAGCISPRIKIYFIVILIFLVVVASFLFLFHLSENTYLPVRHFRKRRQI
jgi:hypothetical protein